MRDEHEVTASYRALMRVKQRVIPFVLAIKGGIISLPCKAAIFIHYQEVHIAHFAHKMQLSWSDVIPYRRRRRASASENKPKLEVLPKYITRRLK
jgi:uncharacterized protein (DUF697 family)